MHQHYSEPIDQEIATIYQRIAQGRTVIRALASISSAGLYPHGHVYAGLPKLAICRADAKDCYWRAEWGGRGRFQTDSWMRANHATNRIVEMPVGSLPVSGNSPGGQAKVPAVPLHLRPKRGLANYYILWEAEWRRTPPGDPMLLRRIGNSDAWLVVAAWDLTPIEQAALATRMNA